MSPNQTKYIVKRGQPLEQKAHEFGVKNCREKVLLFHEINDPSKRLLSLKANVSQEILN